MLDAFARVSQGLIGATSVAEATFNGLSGSEQMIIASAALTLVVKFFILPVVGASMRSGASDTVKKSKSKKKG